MDYDLMLEQRFLKPLSSAHAHPRWPLFRQRLQSLFPELYSSLLALYHDSFCLHQCIEELLVTLWQGIVARPELLYHREMTGDSPEWLLSEESVGAVCYVDLFAGDFSSLKKRIPYLQELGINYLHLMPIFSSPPGKSDGGYAVADYRAFQEHLGTETDFRELVAALQRAGIHLALDFVLNHTSEDHRWARKALEGDPYFRRFYHIFDTYAEVEAYSRNLRDIFPEVRGGSFTRRDDLGAWVWTTFHDYQWDLNYGNPDVFRAMVGEMIQIANLGAEVLRFDALAFLWKESGTKCESLPLVHTLIRAMNCAMKITAPSVQFKSEAIVHPDEVLQYISPDECELSYNPLLMALSWEALATRNPALLRRSIEKRMQIPEACAWVNYVRCHDDIGWTFDDRDAEALGINPRAHRAFLNAFYSGTHPGSFARGVMFQQNLRTGDGRISGTCASLAGLEEGVARQDELLQEHAVRRIVLLYGVAASIGGIPLLYLGDELGLCNHYAHLEDQHKSSDSRWINRVPFDWELADAAREGNGIAAELYSRISTLFRIRRGEPAFRMAPCRIVDGGHRHILGYARTGTAYDLLVLANFSDHAQEYPRERISNNPESVSVTDILTGRAFPDAIVLAPWELVWLRVLGKEIDT